ncbi:hypothetical protein AAC387_Pa01g3810 [Persea americana]
MVKKTESNFPPEKKVIRGAWTAEEDRKLAEYVKINGDKKWRSLPANAGLNRCGKSCRLRWMNYLRPGIKRGNISEDEEDLIIRLHNLIGNRWSLIAGRLPGRTDNEIKNHWNIHLSKKSLTMNELNLKLNHKVETNVDCPSPSSSAISAPDMNWAYPDLKLEVGLDDSLFESEKPWSGPPGKDLGLEIDGFLEFSGGSNEFGMGDNNSYQMEEEGTFQDCLNEKLQESNGGFVLDRETMDSELDFDSLVRLLDHENDDSFHSFCLEYIT